MEQRVNGRMQLGGRMMRPVTRTWTATARRVGDRRIDPALVLAVLWTLLMGLLAAVGGIGSGVILAFWLLGLVAPATAAVVGVFVRRAEAAESTKPPDRTARIILPSSVRSPGSQRRS